MTELPEDVIDYLREMFNDRHASPRGSTSAGMLLEKYKPESKTLADMSGNIIWTRAHIEHEDDDEACAEFNRPQGLYVDSSGLATDDRLSDDDRLVPWPKVEGIDPRELLNDDWQIRCRRDIPEDWDFAWQGDYGINGSSNGTSLQGVPMHAIMFCRPPESDNQ